MTPHLLPLALVLAAAQPGEPVGVAAEPSAWIVFHTIFFTSGDPPWRDLPLTSHLRPDDLADLVPFRPGVFGMVALECAGLTDDGHLKDCHVTAEPKDSGYERAGRALAQDLIAGPTVERPVGALVKFINIQVRLTNPNMPTARGPCWPPSCSFTPAPPPPPARP